MSSASDYTQKLTNRVRATALARAKVEMDNGITRRYLIEGGSGGASSASFATSVEAGTSELTVAQFQESVAAAGTGPAAQNRTQVTETFTSGSSTWTPPFGVDMVEYLLVGGGGGGGGAYDSGGSGGGGGGQVLSGFLPISAIQPYQITIGNGGAGGTANRLASPPDNPGSAGESSTFGSLTALGG